METITITVPSKLADRARAVALMRQQDLVDLIRMELQRALAQDQEIISQSEAEHRAQDDLQNLPEDNVMELANLQMEKWQAQQMHRLIHQAGIRDLTVEED